MFDPKIAPKHLRKFNSAVRLDHLDQLDHLDHHFAKINFWISRGLFILLTNFTNFVKSKIMTAPENFWELIRPFNFKRPKHLRKFNSAVGWTTWTTWTTILQKSNFWISRGLFILLTKFTNCANIHRDKRAHRDKHAHRDKNEYISPG